MDSLKKTLIDQFLDDLTPPGFNDLLVKLQFQSEEYGFLEETVKDMHNPLNKIPDTTQFNV